MAGLLVSVRNTAEAEAALRGGAALLDVKEPANGVLGAASPETIAAIVRIVAGRRPVSAALGELSERTASLPQGCAYLKGGLAHLRETDWQAALDELDRRAEKEAPGARIVRVAYADARHAGAPAVEAICDFACSRPGGTFLLDTWQKSAGNPQSPRPTLLSFLPVSRIAALCRRCRAAGARVALAGSLGPAEIEQLFAAEPDWFAVRGAVCASGDRGATVDEAKVRALAERIGGFTAAIPGS